MRRLLTSGIVGIAALVGAYQHASSVHALDTTKEVAIREHYDRITINNRFTRGLQGERGSFTKSVLFENETDDGTYLIVDWRFFNATGPLCKNEKTGLYELQWTDEKEGYTYDRFITGAMRRETWTCEDPVYEQMGREKWRALQRLHVPDKFTYDPFLPAEIEALIPRVQNVPAIHEKVPPFPDNLLPMKK